MFEFFVNFSNNSLFEKISNKKTLEEKSSKVFE